MTDEPGYLNKSRPELGIYLYVVYSQEPNNIQSFTVAPVLQFTFKALGFQIDSALTNRVVLDLKNLPSERRCRQLAAPCPTYGVRKRWSARVTVERDES